MQRDRRRFLQLLGVGAVALGGPLAPMVRAFESHSPVDWTSLEHGLAGHVVLPGSAEYDRIYKAYNSRFDGIRPLALVLCANREDVVEALRFTRHHGLEVVARGGGHSYAGYSTTRGVVLDLSLINGVALNDDIAEIGGGARLIDIYDQLAASGRALSAGSCPTVGIAGLTLGGGLGVVDRAFGLTCDRLTAAEVVLADGRIVVCNERREPNLFWALRGGGGGNFGVVTRFCFRTHDAHPLTVFSLTWPWSEAAHVFDSWQHWAPDARDELWSTLQLHADQPAGQPPALLVLGTFLGNPSDLPPLVQPLIDGVGSSPDHESTRTLSYRDAMVDLAGCTGLTVPECHTPEQDPAGVLPRELFYARSDLMARSLPLPAIAQLIDTLTMAQAAGAHIRVQQDAFGGAIGRVAPGDTAFVHRHIRYSVQYFAGYPPGTPVSTLLTGGGWLQMCRHAIHPWATGEAYQNYIDPGLQDWRNAYYGANYPRLVHVKAAYDPDNVFHFAQSIPTH